MLSAVWTMSKIFLNVLLDVTQSRNYKDIKATLLMIPKERKIYKWLRLEQWIITSMVHLSNKTLRIMFKGNWVWTLLSRDLEIVETFWGCEMIKLYFKESHQYVGSIELVRESWMRWPIGLGICSHLLLSARELQNISWSNSIPANINIS